MKHFRSQLLGLILCTFTVAPAFAQSPNAAKASQEAYDLYVQGNFKEAEAAYSKLLKEYPTDMVVPSATVQQGFANFFLLNFDKSISILEKAETDTTMPKELLPGIAAFLPQVYGAKAGAMPASDPKRKDAFKLAITKYTNFMEKFPKSDQIESARYGRALCKYQIGEFASAAEDLETNRKEFPKSPTIQDSENLLALALATQGSIELSKGDSADKTKGLAFFKQSKDILQDIIKKNTNLPLVNDARFQLAEILYSEASSYPEAERTPLFAAAREAYRAVVPNNDLITLQESILAGFPERRRKVFTNKAALALLDKEIEREQRRLGELKGKPDMISTSRMKLGEIYFTQGDLNKSRVILRHITPFLAKDDDKMRAQYFLTLTYLLQSQAEDATKNYTLFQEKFKGNPLAQSLPWMMGNLYLSHPNPAIRNPEKAIQYFDESIANYPKGSHIGLSIVSKANAQISLGKMQEAEATFQKVLTGTPSEDEALIARMGLGDIYVRTQQWDKVIAAFQEVINKFPKRPQVTDARYWIAIATQQKGDYKAAIPLLQAMITDFPAATNYLPNVLYSLASAQVTTNDLPAAMETLKTLAEKYPDSAPAPVAYFMQAQILAKGGKPAEANEQMEAFIKKYPENERIFAAYDWLAQFDYNKKEWLAAITKYQEFVDKYPKSPSASLALQRIAEYSKQWAESLGRYGALTTDERKVWEERMAMSSKASTQLISSYPDSAELSPAIQTLIAGQDALITAELKTTNQLELEMKTLAAAATTPAGKSKILFGLATWVAKHDPKHALDTMKEAYNPQVVYSPADLDTYGVALLDAAKLDDAEAVFKKLLADYPVPAGTDPQKATPLVQHAQANSLFGQARIAQERGQTADAGEKFLQLKKNYPWSPKVLEADFGIAQAEVVAGKLDAAIARLPALIRAPNASADLRAKAMLLGGEIQEKKFKLAADQKAKDDTLGAAIDYYIKIDQFYSGVPTVAAEGLWRGAQLLEQQASASSDQEFKKRQLSLAKRSYQDLVKKYPASSHIAAAQARITALP